MSLGYWCVHMQRDVMDRGRSVGHEIVKLGGQGLANCGRSKIVNAVKLI